MKKLYKKIGGGLVIGTVNGMFGAGGGIVAVPLLRHFGISDKSSHAASVAVILPLSVASLVLYLIDGRVSFSDGLPYVLPGLLGAIIGTAVLSKISNKWLHRVFGILIVYAGIRMIFK